MLFGQVEARGEETFRYLIVTAWSSKMGLLYMTLMKCFSLWGSPDKCIEITGIVIMLNK